MGVSLVVGRAIGQNFGRRCDEICFETSLHGRSFEIDDFCWLTVAPRRALRSITPRSPRNEIGGVICGAVAGWWSRQMEITSFPDAMHTPMVVIALSPLTIVIPTLA